MIFDLWDTLVPFPLERWDGMTERLAADLNVPLARFRSLWDQDARNRMVDPIDECLRRAAVGLGATASEAFISDELARRATFHADCLVRPRPEAEATLAALRLRGLKIGVISNCTSEVPAAWRSSPLAPLVDAIAFSSEARIAKPDPRIYAIVLRQLGVEGTECLYVGDGAGDELVGATSMGMRAIQLRYPGIPDHRSWGGDAIATLDQVLALSHSSVAATGQPLNRHGA